MQAQQTNMDVISNNLANTSTVGFKKSRAEFEDLLYHNLKEPGQATGMNSITPTGIQTGLGVRTAAVTKDFELGSAIQTKNPLDLQVEGAGFFQILTPDGQMAYTRDGQFKKDASGRVTDKNGNFLQPALSIPSDAIAIEITQTGEVRVITGNSVGQNTIGQIDIVNFVNPAGLKSIGRNLFVQTEASGQPIVSRPGLQGTGYLAQGQVEGSNVSIVDEMVNMITAQRAYETNSKAIQASDQMLQAINNMR